MGLLGAALLAHTWLAGGLAANTRLTRTAVVFGALWTALAAWLFLARPVAKARLLAVAGSLILGSAFIGLFRVSGLLRLEPRLEPRWLKRPPRAAVVPAAPSAEPPASAPSTSSTAPSASALPDTPSSPSAASAASPTTTGAASAAPTPVPHPVASASWPGYLGPNGNGVVGDVRLARDWSARAPRRLWRRPMGEGWAGFAVDDGIAVTQEQRGEAEHVTALDAATGRELWTHADRARFEGSPGVGVGPRSVPAIAEGRVFTMGATGILNALDLRSGRLLWSHDVLAKHRGNRLDFGKSCSPLVVGRRVVVSTGGPESRSSPTKRPRARWPGPKAAIGQATAPPCSPRWRGPGRS